ncbi:putative purine permease, plant [Rosa chinensis]|uniref:Probable purine permease n=1 Tax=Rosa chinensis TaxID=74649 RepID=A0A2P6Q5B4_ROSCH|nr:putative purine permease, plant [Rosa chinensis]
MSIYTVFVLAGQAIATLLGRQYYDKGGKSNWLATLVQLCGFPIFLPYYCIPALNKNCPTTNNRVKATSNRVKATVYISPCINLCLSWLPYSSRLLFVFSRTILPSCIYFLPHFCIPTHLQCTFLLLPQHAEVNFFNCQLSFILTISSSLLVLQADHSADSSKVSRSKYIIGFVCTVGASAGYALTLSLTQLVFIKVIRKETFRVIMDMSHMTVYTSVIATAIILASSLFSNSISAVGLPIVPVLAVIFFHEKMDGLKAMSLVLAMWGFISYVYQDYLDDRKSKSEKKDANDEVSKAVPVENINV